MMKNPFNYVRLNLAKISIFLLITLSCAFVSHAQHFDLKVDLGEAQQCQLCQNNVDTPPEFTILPIKVEGVWQTIIAQPQLVTVPKISYHRPHLRAPPIN